MTTADDRFLRGTTRWPEHLSLHTQPVDHRRVAQPTERRLPTRAPQARPQAAPAPRAPQRPPVAPPASRAPVAPAPVSRRPPERSAVGRTAALSGAERRRRVLGVAAAVLLAGAALPVQLGAVAVEGLEILSPGPDGTQTALIAAAIAAQVLALAVPAFAAPAIGGFVRRWRARLLVLGANAAVVSVITVVAWVRVGQS